MQTYYRVEWQNPKDPDGVWTDVTPKIWDGEEMVFDEGTLKVGIAYWKKKHPNDKVRYVRTTNDYFEV